MKIKVSTYIIGKTNKLSIQAIQTLSKNVLVFKRIKLSTCKIRSNK